MVFEMRRACADTAAMSMVILLAGITLRTSAFVVRPHQPPSAISSTGSSTGCSALIENRSRGARQQQQGQMVRQLDWQNRADRNLRHVLFLET